MSDDTFIQKFASQYEWQIAPAKRRFRFRKEVNKGMRESHRLALTMKGVVDRALDDVEGLQASDYSTYQIFEAGDLAFKLIDLENIKTSRVGLVPRRGIMSPAYIRLTPTHRDADTRFYAWFFFAVYFNNIFNGMGGGVRQNLTPTDLLEFPIPLPDLATQRQIADFLDRETARIDLLIEKKQRLVALLGEREENYIRGVLSGENTDFIDKKTTEAPWLKSVPRRWDVVPLRHLVKIQTGSRDTKDREDDGQYPFFVRSMTVERINSYSFDEEAVLTSGDGAGVGIVFHHINCQFDLHQRMYAFTDFKRVSGRYFYFFLRTFFKLQMTQWSAKSTVDSVRMPFLKTLLVTVPPKEEQKRLVEDIENRAQRDALVKERTLVSIDRLKEYRSALITAAVTGQIDVTTYAKSGTPDRRLDAIQEEMGA